MQTKQTLTGTVAATQYTYSYDANGKLNQVKNNTGAIIAEFTYDAGGMRVLSKVNGVKTIRIAGIYEKEITGTGATAVTKVTKYYDGVALRVGSGTLQYLHRDHLGGVIAITDSSGAITRQERYKPFGETLLDARQKSRGAGTNTPTTQAYTGQKRESSFGLYDYNARWYDSAIGRFTQADTIVPNPASAKAFDRYAYVENNPIRYSDPSGHFIPGGCPWCRTVAEFAWGFVYQIIRTNREALPIPVTPKQRQVVEQLQIDSDAFYIGRLAGAVTSTAQGIAEAGGGLALATGGGAAGALACVPTVGAGCVAGAGVAVEGAIVSAHGAMVALQGVKDTIEITALLARRQGQGFQNVPTKYNWSDLPKNPDDLLAAGWREVSHPSAAAAGHRTFISPDGVEVRFDAAKPGEFGFKRFDHYHVVNPNSSQGKLDQYLDVNGNPVSYGSDDSHIIP
jgi:RHS repeat-associated protein